MDLPRTGISPPAFPSQCETHRPPIDTRYIIPPLRLETHLLVAHARADQALTRLFPIAFPPTTKATFHPAKKWSVQLQHVGRGNTALRYLARYVKRSAILLRQGYGGQVGPKRIIGYDKQGNIRIHWTCSGSGKPGILSLSPDEFIRRWLIHVLPKGFARVRHYGFMSAAAVATRRVIRLHLGADPDPDPQPEVPEPQPHTCPCCGGNLTFLRKWERSGHGQERTRRAPKG